MKPQTGKRKLKPSGIDWIGDVPEGWGVDKFCYRFDFAKGLNITKQDLTETGVPVVSYGQIHSRHNDGVHLTNELLRYIPDELTKGESSARLKRNDFVFADTSEDVEGIGNCVTVNRDEAIYAGYHTLIARPIEEVDCGYFGYLFKSECWRQQLRRKANSVKVYSISQRLFKGVSVLLPPLDEQKRIAAKLDRLCGRIDELSANLTKEIAALQDYRKSLITECVTKGLNPKTKMKHSGIDWIGDMPEGWRILRVGLCFRRHGSGTTPSSDNLTYYEGENNWVQSGDLHGDAVYKTEKHLSDAALQECALTVYKAPFIAVAMYGASIANTSKVMIDACTNQACCVLCEPEDDIELEYCFYAIKAARKVLIEAGRGGGQPNINRDIVRKLKIPVPTVMEQREIAAYLDKHCAVIDAKIAERQRQLEKLAEYRASAIYEYVTGKKEVAA